MAAQKHHDVPRPEGREGLLDRVRVGSLGVVHKAHAGNLAAGLDAVLERREGEKPATHVPIGNTQLERHGRGHEGVLLVVLALDEKVVGGDKDVLGAVEAHHEAAVAHEGGARRTGVLAHVHAAHAQAPRVEAANHGAAPVVAVRDHGKVPRLEVGKDLLLCLGIRLHAAVPLHVVRRDVHEAGDVRVQKARGCQLEARELGYEPRSGLALSKAARDDGADVAHGLGDASALAQERRGERGRGGLPVGAGDAHPVGGALAPGKLRLANDLRRMRGRRPEEGGPHGDARGGYGQIEGALDLLGTQDAANAQSLELMRNVTLVRGGAAKERDRGDPLAKPHQVAADGLARVPYAKNGDVAKTRQGTAVLHEMPPSQAGSTARNQGPQRRPRRSRSG